MPLSWVIDSYASDLLQKGQWIILSVDNIVSLDTTLQVFCLLMLQFSLSSKGSLQVDLWNIRVSILGTQGRILSWTNSCLSLLKFLVIIIGVKLIVTTIIWVLIERKFVWLININERLLKISGYFLTIRVSNL